MNLLQLLINRLGVMFLFMIIGAILFRTGKITEKGSEALASLLITLILPCVILRSFLTEITWQQIRYLLFAILFSCIILFLSLLAARVFFKKDAIADFASAFSNPGFFGIPLITSVLGDTAVLYAAPFIALLNILQSSYGVSILNRQSGPFRLRKILLSPFVISFLLGLLFLFVPICLPTVVEEVIHSSAGLNTPIAMIVTGIYLAKVNPKAMFRNRKLYGISLVRLLLIPFLSLGVLSLLPSAFYPMKMCLLIASACPVGTNVAVYAQLHGKDYRYAAETVVISTLFSAITIPIFIMAAQFLWST